VKAVEEVNLASGIAVTSATPLRLTRDTLIPLIEIAVILAPVLTIMWITPLLIPEKPKRDQVDLSLMLLTILIGMGLNVYHREGLRDIGLRLDNFTQAARALFWFTLIGSLVIVGIGLTFDSINLGERFITHLKILPFWGLLQHYGLQSIINRRLQRAWGQGRWSIWLTAVIFSALHLPNPTLAIGTLSGGYFWASAFQRHPNLIALALSHALLSALLANTFPAILLPNMKVGWGYF